MDIKLKGKMGLLEIEDLQSCVATLNHHHYTTRVVVNGTHTQQDKGFRKMLQRTYKIIIF